MTPAQMQWARCRHWIEAAAAEGPGLENMEDVERQVEAGRLCFFPGESCAALVEIAHFGGHRVGIIIYAGGDKDELLNKLEPIMAEYARLQGCDRMMIMGRKGWERACAPLGYRFASTTLLRELKE